MGEESIPGTESVYMTLQLLPSDFLIYEEKFIFFFIHARFLLFWTQKQIASLVAISGTNKVSVFRAHPLPMALEMNLPASKASRPSPYQQQVH
jgi:hypothetical protein